MLMKTLAAKPQLRRCTPRSGACQRPSRQVTCLLIASCIRPRESTCGVALSFFFWSGCACRAVCCPVLPRAGLHVLSSVSICVSIRMHMSIYICISQCVQVPTGSRAGGDERGLQLMVTLQGCAEAMKGEGFDSCNQPCFAKFLPAAQGGRLLQAAGRSIPTGLSSAPCTRVLEYGAGR